MLHSIESAIAYAVASIGGAVAIDVVAALSF